MSTSEHRFEVLELVKSIFDNLSNANRGAWFAFEETAWCCAHNLRAVCAQIPHLHHAVCFVRGTRPRTKRILILFRRARRNSTRFLQAAAPQSIALRCCFFIRLSFSALRRGSSIAGWRGSHSPDAPYSRLRTGSYRRGDRSQGRETSRRPRQRKHGSRWN